MVDFDRILSTAFGVIGMKAEHSDGWVDVRMAPEEWDAVRCVLLSLKLADLLEQQKIIQAHPKLVAACHAALSLEGLPTPVRKQLEKALALAEF